LCAERRKSDDVTARPVVCYESDEFALKRKEAGVCANLGIHPCCK
jgi:hypothetical protein